MTFFDKIKCRGCDRMLTPKDKKFILSNSETRMPYAWCFDCGVTDTIISDLKSIVTFTKLWLKKDVI